MCNNKADNDHSNTNDDFAGDDKDIDKDHDKSQDTIEDGEIGKQLLFFISYFRKFSVKGKMKN